MLLLLLVVIHQHYVLDVFGSIAGILNSVITAIENALFATPPSTTVSTTSSTSVASTTVSSTTHSTTVGFTTTHSTTTILPTPSGSQIICNTPITTVNLNSSISCAGYSVVLTNVSIPTSYLSSPPVTVALYNGTKLLAFATSPVPGYAMNFTRATQTISVFVNSSSKGGTVAATWAKMWMAVNGTAPITTSTTASITSSSTASSTTTALYSSTTTVSQFSCANTAYLRVNESVSCPQASLYLVDVTPGNQRYEIANALVDIYNGTTLEYMNQSLPVNVSSPYTFQLGGGHELQVTVWDALYSAYPVNRWANITISYK